MIPAASQTLAGFFARELAQLSQEQISFEHPRTWQRRKPGLNLYCYHIQESEFRGEADCHWFDLTFLVSVTDYTSLGEQGLFSNVLRMLSQYPLLPESVLDRTLRGYGAVRLRVSTQAPVENVLFWKVLHAPLQLALHLTLTVPYHLSNQTALYAGGLSALSGTGDILTISNPKSIGGA